MPLPNPEWPHVVRIVGGVDAVLEGGLAEVQRNNSNPCGLDDFEKLLIWVYSSTDDGWYELINGQLWSSPGSDVRVFATLLDATLSKLPSFDGEVYRGYFAKDFEAFMLNYYVGKTIVWPGFTSTSLNYKKAFAGNILFRITSQSAKILGNYADRITEEEALFPTQTKFRVTRVERDTASAVVWLDEIV